MELIGERHSVLRARLDENVLAPPAGASWDSGKNTHRSLRRAFMSFPAGSLAMRERPSMTIKKSLKPMAKRFTITDAFARVSSAMLGTGLLRFRCAAQERRAIGVRAGSRCGH